MHFSLFYEVFSVILCFSTNHISCVNKYEVIFFIFSELEEYDINLFLRILAKNSLKSDALVLVQSNMY